LHEDDEFIIDEENLQNEESLEDFEDLDIFPGITQVDRELDEITHDIESLKIENPCSFQFGTQQHSNTPIEIEKSPYDADVYVPDTYENHFEEMYVNKKLVKDLKINFGTADLPRFSCACHKLNLAIRKAISKHRKLNEIVKKLNTSNAHVRKSINLTKIFAKKNVVCD
jgi:hypothetical protein